MPTQEAIITVPFAELDGSPTENLASGSVSLVRRFKLAWEDTPTFVRQVLGTSAGVSGLLARTLPMRYDETRFANAFANRVTVEPHGRDKAGIVTPASGTTVNGYAKAIVEVEYIPQDIDQISDPEDDEGAEINDPLVSEQIEVGAEFLTVEVEGMTWYAPGKGWDGSAIGPGVSISKLMPLMEWTVTRMQVAVIPDEVFTRVGFTNDVALKSPTFRRSFKPYNALYLGASISRALNVFGNGDFEINARFAIRQGGQVEEGDGTWLESFNPREGEWGKPAISGSPIAIYPEADLNPVVGVFTAS